jgi:hypothetical protein
MQGLVEAAIVALALVGVVWALAAWKKFQREWCVIVYLVSRDTNARFKWPDLSGVPSQNELDVKLDQVVECLESLPCGDFRKFLKKFVAGENWNNVHVVYRAVWNDHPIRPNDKPVAVAKVVSWQVGAPDERRDQSFRDFDPSDPGDNDMDGFFKWAYKTCPAKHYAVFFWGHSIGPGGLFELSQSPAFPQLPGNLEWAPPADLAGVRDTLQAVFDQRNININLVASPRVLGPAGSPPGGASQPGGAVQPAGPPGSLAMPAKIEIALFQDCWMSTLETAYELRDIVRYVVGSQSLVPIGYQYDASHEYSAPTGPVWPYEQLIGRLLADSSAFAVPVFDELQAFFETPEANRLPYPITAFSLLDLGTAGEIGADLTPLFRTLVQELAQLSRDERRFFLRENAVLLFENDNPNKELLAGDWALLDVVRLCTKLSTPSTYAVVDPPNRPALITAAAALLPVLGVPQPGAPPPYVLVSRRFEAPSTTPPLGFNGVSLLFLQGPTPPRGDPYIAKQIDGTFYEGLAFVNDTAAAGTNWALIAFAR